MGRVPLPAAASLRSSDHGWSKLNGRQGKLVEGLLGAGDLGKPEFGWFPGRSPRGGEDASPLWRGSSSLTSSGVMTLAVFSGPTMVIICRQGLGAATRRQHRSCQSTEEPHGKKIPQPLAIEHAQMGLRGLNLGRQGLWRASPTFNCGSRTVALARTRGLHMQSSTGR